MVEPAAASAGVDIPGQGVILPIVEHLPTFDASAPHSAGPIESFVGIPFAQPPVGELRWRPPRTPPPSWRDTPGPRQSSWDFAAPIAEPGTAKSPFYVKRAETRRLPQDAEAEDCLYLNIWRPASVKAGNDVPVLFWVYGGSFTSGSTLQASYDGARLASVNDCIVVTANYRLGPFGFGACRELYEEAQGSDEEPRKGCGNYGIWDVVEAMKWVQTNIGHFGGDAANVTAFGESAGSMIVHYMLLSDVVPQGLFHRAYLMSGTAEGVPARSLESAQAAMDGIATELGVASNATAQEKLLALRSADASTIAKLAFCRPVVRPRTEYRLPPESGAPVRRLDSDTGRHRVAWNSWYSPVWDGHMVPVDMRRRVERGLPPALQLRNGRGGLLISYCVDEGLGFNPSVQSEELLKKYVANFNATLQPELRRLYDVANARDEDGAMTPFLLASLITGDQVFHCPTRRLWHVLAARSSPRSPGYEPGLPACYATVFSHHTSYPHMVSVYPHVPTAKTMSMLGGVMHSAETSYVFGFQGEARLGSARRREDGGDGEMGQESAETTTGTTTTTPASVPDGFSLPERRLSLRIMTDLGRFARGGAVGAPLSSSATRGGQRGAAEGTMEVSSATETASSVVRLADVPLRTYGHRPQRGMGASSPEARRAIAVDLAGHGVFDVHGDLDCPTEGQSGVKESRREKLDAADANDIPVLDMRFGEHLAHTHFELQDGGTGGSKLRLAPLEERQRFWMGRQPGEVAHLGAGAAAGASGEEVVELGAVWTSYYGDSRWDFRL